jgi:hypothetical protein
VDEGGRSRRTRWLFVAYAICLVVAGLNHARDIWQGGWLPYRHDPLIMNYYWTSLTALDPLAAALLFWTLVIIVSDVAVNSFARYGLGNRGWYGDVSLQLQTLFLGFVVGSLPFVWHDARRVALRPQMGPEGGAAGGDDAVA